MTHDRWVIIVVALVAAASALALDGARRVWPRPSTRSPTSRSERPASGLLVLIARLGSSVRSRAGRPPDVASDLRVGWALLLFPVGLLVHPIVAIAVSVVPTILHVVQRRRGRAAAERRLVQDLPDVVDMFRIAAGGGLTVHESVREVGAALDGPIATRLSEAERRVGLGERLSDVLPLVAEAGEPVRPLVRALVSAERDGAPLAAPLERAAEQARDLRRRRAEESARTIPVRLLFPLVACVLPAFVLLTVVPLLAATLRSLMP